MSSIRKYRQSWLRWREAYERKAYKIVQSAFNDIGNSIPFDKLTPSTYIMYIEATVSNDAIAKAYFDIYYEIGVAHGLRVGKMINDDIKDFTVDKFIQAYREGLMNWVLENAGTRILSVRNGYIAIIKELIAQGLRDQKTMIEITKEIVKLVNSPTFYRWQAMRIARTETTAAANRGAVSAGNTSGVIYEKVWISANDARTRRIPPDEYDHQAMNGIRVLKEEAFSVPNKYGSIEMLPFAGSPNTIFGTQSHGGNVINCRCSNAIVVKRDANGRIIRI